MVSLQVSLCCVGPEWDHFPFSTAFLCSSVRVSMERQVEALLTEDAMMQTLVGASEPGAQIPRADRLAPVKSPPGVECLLQDGDGQGGRTNEVSPNVQSEPAQLPGQKQPRGRTGCVLA